MQSRGNNKKIQMSKYMVYIVLAVVFVFFAITLRDNGFASTQNLLNILRQTAMISIMSVAGVLLYVKCRDGLHLATEELCVWMI